MHYLRSAFCAILTLLLLLLGWLPLINAAVNTPQHIHVHLTGNDSQLLVTWSVPSSCGVACLPLVAVRSGLTGPWRNQSRVTSTTTLDGSMGSAALWTITNVLLDVTPGSTVYYVVGGLASGAPTFMSQPARNRLLTDGTPTSLPPDFSTTTAPLRILACLADIGLANSLSLPRLINDSARGLYDHIALAGDLAYDLSTSLGGVGDAFLGAIQPVVAQQPLILGVGNHECASSGAAAGTGIALRCFESFVRRFSGVADTAGVTSRSGTNQWYSVDDPSAGVHYVVVSSELWFYTGSAQNITDQYAWLQADILAVNRTRTPWVIALSHKSVWHDSTNFTIMERILNAGRTDIMFVGHQHNAARLYPADAWAGTVETGTGCVSPNKRTYRDCYNMTTLVVGSPGNHEGITTSVLAASKTAWQAFAYGYGYLYIVNRTHLYHSWVQTADVYGNATAANDTTAARDEVWVIKTREKPIALPLVIPGALDATPAPSISLSVSKTTSSSPTRSRTLSGTSSNSRTRSVTPTASPSSSSSASASASSSVSASGSLSSTRSGSRGQSSSGTPSARPSSSLSHSRAASATGTRTPPVSKTSARTGSSTSSASASASASGSASSSASVSISRTRSGAATHSGSVSGSASASTAPSVSASATADPTPSASPSLTGSPTLTTAPTPSGTPSAPPTLLRTSSSSASGISPHSGSLTQSPTSSRSSTRSSTRSRSGTHSPAATATSTKSSTGKRTGTRSPTSTHTSHATLSSQKTSSRTASSTRKAK